MAPKVVTTPPSARLELAELKSPAAPQRDMLTLVLSDLRQAAVDRDRATFNQIFPRLYELYQNRAACLLQLSSFGAGTRGQQPDVAQEFFLHLSRMEVVEKYNPSQPARQWLDRILKNKFVDVLRQNKRHVSMTLAEAGSPELPVELPDKRAIHPGSRLQFEEECQAIREALGKLTLSHLKIFRGNFIEGLKYAEISQSLGIPLGTVKSSLNILKKRVSESCDALHDPSSMRDTSILSRGLYPQIKEFLDSEIARKSSKGDRKTEAAVA